MMKNSLTLDSLNVRLFLMISVFALGLLLGTAGIEDFFKTYALLVLVTFISINRVNKLSKDLGDINIKAVGSLYLLKLVCLLALLFFSWGAGLNQNLPDFGYDPQRYYFYSIDFLNSGFDTSVIAAENLNYVGIVYYYAFIFLLFGANSVAPVLVNSFVTLMATLFMINLGYAIKGGGGRRYWILGLCMLLPEVLWFDLMTSRETLAMSLITLSSLSIVAYFVEIRNFKFGLKGVIFIAVPSMFLLALVRSSALMAPLITGILFMLFIYRSRFSLISIAGVLFSVVLVFFVANEFSVIMGSSGVGLTGYFDMLTAQDQGVIEGWRSTEGLGIFARILIPNNFIEAVLFVPFRLILYLLSPLGVNGFDLMGLFNGSWMSWQFLMMSFSGLINLIFFPYALASLVDGFKNKKTGVIGFNIATWATLLMIAGGNFIIHDRYRVMASLLLWGSYWLGWGAPKIVVKKLFITWFLIILIAILFYIVIKIMN